MRMRITLRNTTCLCDFFVTGRVINPENIIEETVEKMAAEGDDASQGMKLKEAMKEVLKESLKHDGLARGLRESVKALDKRQAFLCVVAKNCSEAGYLRLVEALCNEHQISLLKVEDKEELGEWVGLCKIDRDGKPRKVVKCSCVVVKDIGTDTEAWNVVQEYIKTQAAAV